jgi:hypothetical protein
MKYIHNIYGLCEPTGKVNGIFIECKLLGREGPEGRTILWFSKNCLRKV